MEMELSRRQLLAGIGAAGIGVVGLRRSQSQQTGFVVSSSNPRAERYRPVAGGSWMTSELTDGFGTLGTAVDHDGSPAVITNRHVVDGSADQEPDELVGTVVQQVDADDGRIGRVVAASKLQGQGASDWAVVELDESSFYPGSETLGLGDLGEPIQPIVGDRIVIDGARTGLLGGTVTDTGVSANFRGKLLTDLIEYQVDENRETSGNSGGVVAVIRDGVVRPMGLHTFGFDKIRYAVSWSDLPSGVTVDSVADSIGAESDQTWVEGVVAGRSSSGSWQVWISNLGGGEATETVQLFDGSAEDKQVASQDVTLGSRSQSFLELGAAQFDSVRLVVGETDMITVIEQ